jgi:hypothetical protein
MLQIIAKEGLKMQTHCENALGVGELVDGQVDELSSTGDPELQVCVCCV